MYQYKQERSVEEWSDFALNGYKNAESEDIPLHPDSFRDLAKELGNVMDQVKYLFNQKPLILAALIVGFITLVTVSFWCTAKISDKLFAGQQEGSGTAQNADGTGAADASNSSTTAATAKEGRPKTD